MTGPRESHRLARGLCLAVLVAHVMAGAANYWSLLRETRLVFPVRPKPFYAFMPVPVPGADRPALGADFSQVYVAASALRHGDSAYEPRNPAFRDRFGRRPNYPPFTNYLYVPLSLLPYQDALLLHVTMGLVLLAGLTFLVLTKLGHRGEAPLAILTSLMLVVLTPVGFAQLERGQFDLFVASSFMLVTAAIYAGRWATPLAVAAAALGALKWTAAPFLLGLSGVVLVASGGLRRRVAFWAVPAVLLASIGLFAGGVREYWPSLRFYELAASPTEVSLERFLPTFLAKAVPVSCTAGFAGLFLWRARRGWDRQVGLEAVAPPFALGLCLLTLCVPKVAYEYRVAAMLGLLPVLFVWLERALVPSAIRRAVALLYGVFCVIAFRVFDFGGDLMTSAEMLSIYCATALGFLGLAVHILWRLPFVAPPACPDGPNPPAPPLTSAGTPPRPLP